MAMVAAAAVMREAMRAVFMPPTVDLAAQRAAQRPLNGLIGSEPSMVEFRVLGPFDVVSDGVPIDLGGARRRALLALLVLSAGKVIGSERLVDELWGERPPATAGHVLHVYVSALRKLLPADVIVSRPPGYVLEVAPEAIDLQRFERLVAVGRKALQAGDPQAAASAFDDGLALWRGPVLEDFAADEFVQAEARRLDELRLAARELRAEAGIGLGGGPEVIAELEALSREHPYRERGHALLMRALAADGRQAEALAAYQAVRARLDDELGIEPGEELRAAHLAVLRQEVTPVAAPAVVASRGVVLAVAGDPQRLAAVAAVADAAALGSDRELIVACVLPRGETPPDVAGAARVAADVRRTVRSEARSAAFASRDEAHDIAALAAENEADLVLLDIGQLESGRARLPQSVRSCLEAVTADVALLAGDPPLPGTLIAAPFGGGTHDWAATELAALIARGGGGSLRLIGVTTADDDASRLVARAALAVQRAVGLDAEPALAEAGVESLVAAAGGSGGLVIGVSDRWRSEGLGETRRALVASAGSALVVRRGVRPGLLAPPDARTRFGWSAAG
jgi:DNA-binding SARP family transcriptional activator